MAPLSLFCRNLFQKTIPVYFAQSSIMQRIAYGPLYVA